MPVIRVHRGRQPKFKGRKIAARAQRDVTRWRSGRLRDVIYVLILDKDGRFQATAMTDAG